MSVDAADSIPQGGAGYRRCIGTPGDRTVPGIAKVQLVVVGGSGLSLSVAYQYGCAETDLDVD